jgi:hypothetical protein
MLPEKQEKLAHDTHATSHTFDDVHACFSVSLIRAGC